MATGPLGAGSHGADAAASLQRGSTCEATVVLADGFPWCEAQRGVPMEVAVDGGGMAAAMDSATCL
jgi:hypothetical protein